MKVLIIPDVHLKPWMFTDAETVMSETGADRAVCLGDLVDDFGCGGNEALYQQTLDGALAFERRHSDTLWCFGNHDLAYLWNVWVTGTSGYENVRRTALDGLRTLYHEIPESCLGFVHRIDKVLFSHAGISRMFVRDHLGVADYGKTDVILDGINDMHLEDMWNNDSPIWLRPQREFSRAVINMYKPRTFLQAVGHTPMKQITQEGNILSCDVFSLYRDRTPYGSQEFCLLDTETWEWRGISVGHRTEKTGAFDGTE